MNCVGQKVGENFVEDLHDFEILSIPFEWRNFIFSWVQFTEMGSRIFSRAPILKSSIIISISSDGPVWDSVGSNPNMFGFLSSIFEI